MTKHILRFLCLSLYLTYSYAGVKVLDIEIGKTKVIDLWKKGYISTITDPHPHLKGYYRHYYRLPKKVNGGNEMMVTAKGTGIIQAVYTQVDRKNIKQVYEKISKNYTLINKMDTGPFGNYFFEKEDTTIYINDLPNLPYLCVNYYDTSFAKSELR